MKLSRRIDWVTFTFSHDSYVAVQNYDDALAALGYLKRDLQIPDDKVERGYSSDRWYDYIFTFHDTRIRVGFSKRKSVGVRVEMSGSAITELNDLGYDFMAHFGVWRITRIDYAVDVVGSKIQIAELYHHFMGQNNGITHSYRHSATGDTFYVGSRKSDKYFRFYDKGAELGLPESDHIRLEVEVKGATAKALSGRSKESVHETLHNILTDRVQLVSPVLYEHLLWLCADNENPIEALPRRGGAGYMWFEQTVVAALRKLRERDYRTYLEVSHLLIDEISLVDVATSLPDNLE